MSNTFRKALSAAIAAASVATLTLGPATSASATPVHRPAVKTRTVTVDGTAYRLVLAANDTRLSAKGQDVEVFGVGYNADQGIFVALCVIPDSVDVNNPATYTTLPTPCLGGREDKSGASHRVTNSATGTPGITSAYGPHGSFRATLRGLKPEISPGTVCDVDVRCAIVTRADFTATSDRSYDMYIPVSFRG